MISHNKEFYGALCTEEWFLEGGGLRVEGKVDEMVSGLLAHAPCPGSSQGPACRPRPPLKKKKTRRTQAASIPQGK